MLSEAIHSVADTCNQGLLLIGGKRSMRAADEAHQFGYGRTRYVYAFIVAIIIFLLGGLFSLYEGWHKFHHPEPLEKVWIAYVVLIVSIVLETWSFRTALREANKSRGSQVAAAVRARGAPARAARRSCWRTPAPWSACVFALFGVFMAETTGDYRWDGVGAIAIGTLLVIIAIFLAIEMSSMLVGESALPEEEDAIRAALGAAPGVRVDHPHAHAAHRARRAAGGRQGRGLAGHARLPGPGRDDRRGRGPDPGGDPHRALDLPRARHPTRVAVAAEPSPAGMRRATEVAVPRRARDGPELCRGSWHRSACRGQWARSVATIAGVSQTGRVRGRLRRMRTIEASCRSPAEPPRSRAGRHPRAAAVPRRTATRRA